MSLRRPRKRPGATHPAVLRLGDLSREQRRVLAAASQVLKEHGARGYLVGGLIRDYLRGEKTDDIDLVVAGIEPAAVAGHISRLLGFSRPVVFPRFKTVLVVGAGLRIETCRLQGDLGPDAMLRDFTANCLYADLRRVGRDGDRVGLLDPTGVGLTDLKAGLLRTPSDPCFTMWLDPLRILRAIRFYAVGGFRLDGCSP
jgi:poly(A) polymerase